MNAVTKMDAMPLDYLISEWKDAKATESLANQVRLKIEARILAHPDCQVRPEGTTKFGNLSITTGTTREWDQEQLDELRATIRGEYWPFIRTWREDRKASKVMEDRFPDLWMKINQALTLKPKKPSFSVKES